MKWPLSIRIENLSSQNWNVANDSCFCQVSQFSPSENWKPASSSVPSRFDLKCLRYDICGSRDFSRCDWNERNQRWLINKQTEGRVTRAPRTSLRQQQHGEHWPETTTFFYRNHLHNIMQLQVRSCAANGVTDWGTHYMYNHVHKVHDCIHKIKQKSFKKFDNCTEIVLHEWFNNSFDRRMSYIKTS